MEIKRFNDFLNEGIREKMTGKSKEELKKAVDNLPLYKKLTFIEKFEITDLYSDEEMDEIYEGSPNIVEQGKWYHVSIDDEDDGGSYDVLVHSNGSYAVYDSRLLEDNYTNNKDEVIEVLEGYLKMMYQFL